MRRNLGPPPAGFGPGTFVIRVGEITDSPHRKWGAPAPGRWQKCTDYRKKKPSGRADFFLGAPIGHMEVLRSPMGQPEHVGSKSERSECFPQSNPRIFDVILVRVARALRFRCGPAAFSPIRTTKATGSSPG